MVTLSVIPPRANMPGKKAGLFLKRSTRESAGPVLLPVWRLSLPRRTPVDPVVASKFVSTYKQKKFAYRRAEN
jgi:hypothetical protein